MNGFNNNTELTKNYVILMDDGDVVHKIIVVVVTLQYVDEYNESLDNI